MKRRLSVGIVIGLLMLAAIAGRATPAASAPTGLSVGTFGQQLWLGSAPFDPLKETPAVDPALTAAPESDLYVAQLDVARGMRQSQQAFFLKAAAVNARVLGYLPDAAYLVRVAQPGAEQLRSAVRAIVAFHPAYKVNAAATKSAALTVVTLPDSNAGELASQLRTEGITAAASSSRIAVVANRKGLIQALAYDARVLAIEPRVAYKTFNTDARWVTQSAQRDYTPLTNVGLNGTNEAVGIADTGNNYYPDQVGQANFYFSDCQNPLAPTRATCKLADYTYEAPPAPGGSGDVTGGMLHTNATNHRKMLAYFDEVGDGDPNSPSWHGDSGSSTHGSHVSGSVAGARPALNANATVVRNANGTVSYPGNQPYDGQAPNAKIIFQDIGTDGEGLNGLPGDLYLLFDQSYDLGNDASSDSTINFGSDPAPANAYQRGVTPRVHSNSWGSFIPEISLGNSPRLDDFVVGHEDFLPVFAAGNSGPDGASIGEPGTAKDALTVGATANGRDDYASLDTMANFSSHGAEFVTTDGTCAGNVPATPLGKTPLGDAMYSCPETGAIKPDVATPGLHMISAKGGTDTAVQVLQGTSMATPTAAGDAVLVRQYFDDGFGPAGGSGFAPGAKGAARAYNASAALVKAVMIASAQRMRGWYTGDLSTATNHSTDGQWPSSGQGWGRIQLDSALHFNDIAKSPQLYVQDVTYALGHDTVKDGLSTGDQRSYPISVGAGQPLRVVLDWSDPGGLASFLGLGPEALTNHLQLEVDDPNGVPYCGNNIDTRNPINAGNATATSLAGGCDAFVIGSGGPSTDNFNNVQVVYLPSPQPGNYTIKVQGLLVAQPQDTVGIMVGGSGAKQGFALAATGNLAGSGIPATIAGTPLPTAAANVTTFSSTAVSGDATVLRWTTDSRTTSGVTISGPGVGGNRTLPDDYSYNQTDFPGLSITQMETQGQNFLHVPVISDHHEVKLTGLSPGGTYTVTFTVNGHATSTIRSFRTPATSYAPQIGSETATLFSGPAGVPEPINDPTGTDPWGNSSQLYIGQLPPTPLAITPPPADELAIGAFKMVTPSNAPTTNLAGAAVLVASRHDITSHVQEMPATSLDLVQSAPDTPGTWGPGTGYGPVKNDPTLAHLFPNFGHLRTSALTWEPYTVTCNDLKQLTSSLSGLHMASFRASASYNTLLESVYGFESGFGRRSTGLEYRPLLVLFPNNSDPLRQPGGTPHVSDVRVERQDTVGTVVVYWQTDVAANSLVLIKSGADTYQVGSPAYTKVHQVQLNGVALGTTLAVRSVSSTGQSTTSGAFAVPDAIVTPALAPPPAPALAPPASGSFATTPTHQSATPTDKLHGTGYGCAPLSSGGGGHEGDGGGDVQGDNGDSGHMSFDEDPGEDNDAESVQWHDNGSGKDFQSTQIQSVQFDDTVHSITIAGVGLNGGQPVTFLMQAIEATDVAPAWYSLTLSDGFAISGNLTGGAITLH